MAYAYVHGFGRCQGLINACMSEAAPLYTETDVDRAAREETQSYIWESVELVHLMRL